MSNVDMQAESGDYIAMKPYWDLVTAIMGGAATMRDASAEYLPQFPAESTANYAYRVANSKFVNVFEGIVGDLAAKPFDKEVALVGDRIPERLTTLMEDVDGSGNHLHVFASGMFLNGLVNAVDWLLVDHTVVAEGATRADEQRAGSRPHWVRIAGSDMLAVYSAMINGQEKVTYARFMANETVRDGVEEKIVERVRVLKREQTVTMVKELEVREYGVPVWEVWEKVTSSGEWVVKESGTLSIGEIPLVAFAPGRRVPATWQFKQPMKAIAELQVEHYQQETNLKNAKELTAFPMLAGNGISKPKNADGTDAILVTGPSCVLYSPPSLADGKHGEWKLLEVSATSLEFLSKEVKRTEEQMHELGRQPLLQGTAGITQVAAALTSQQASSALQAWAFQLKDSLEQGVKFTCMWLQEPVVPSVYVNTDFEIGIDDGKEPAVLLDAHKEGVISAQTLRAEFKRRNLLSPEFDEDEELDRLLTEVPGDADDADPATAGVNNVPELDAEGNPVEVAP